MRVYWEGEKIYFCDEAVNKLGSTNFNECLWENIKDLKFTVKFKNIKSGKEPQYIYCSKLKKTLHQIVMDFYYGEDIRKEMYKNGFIIEHHDNDGFNCCIENLSFFPNDKNKSKAFGYDKDRIRMMNRIAMNIFKDFKTQKYQITVAFNEHFALFVQDKLINLATIYLVYEDNYKIVINDATSILDLIEANNKFELQKLNCENWDYNECKMVYISEEEKDSPIILRDGNYYMNMNCPHQRITRASAKEELY